MDASCTVRPLATADRGDWQRLYTGYLEHYKLVLRESQLDRVWQWLNNPSSGLEGFVAETSDGRVLGLAHCRAVLSPSAACVDGFLEDLFVDPDHRGRGIADLLLVALRDLAKARGWSVLQWMTADDNYRARGKYDQYAQRTGWLIYEMTTQD